jgi:hypothetical protein
MDIYLILLRYGSAGDRPAGHGDGSLLVILETGRI